jgi:ubiquinone/menaquinone biosynthesis C-methylase UbiE
MVGEMEEKRILELATGTGSCVEFVRPNNRYTGTDISSGLLKRAKKRLVASGFKHADLYLTPAEDLPFAGGSFDLCLCILALNFFDDASRVFAEIRRVLVPEGTFICSVPVPERKPQNAVIRGTLHGGEALEIMSRDNGFSFDPLPADNGALLYLRAVAV